MAKSMDPTLENLRREQARLRDTQKQQQQKPLTALQEQRQEQAWMRAAQPQREQKPLTAVEELRQEQAWMRAAYPQKEQKPLTAVEELRQEQAWMRATQSQREPLTDIEELRQEQAWMRAAQAQGEQKPLTAITVALAGKIGVDGDNNEAFKLNFKQTDSVTKGLAPSLAVINPMDTPKDFFYRTVGQKKPPTFKTTVNVNGVHNILYKDKLAGYKSVFRVDRPGTHNTHTKAGRVPRGAHLNVEAPPNSTRLAKKLASKLDEKQISKLLYDAIGDFDKLKKVGKVGGKALAVVGFAMDAYDVATAVSADLTDSDQKLGKKTAAAVGGAALSWVGAAAGAKLGAMGGAAIGTLILPGLGTVIGGFIGGLAGGIIGGAAGRGTSDYIVDQINWEE